jgi:hypothetical protein
MRQGAIIMNMKPHKLTPILILLIVTPLFAAKFWETKEFTSWTDKECNEILTKSPWAYSNSFGDVPAIGSQTAGIDSRSQGVGEANWGEAESTQVFEFRLLAAKPIRMALARRQMLQAPNAPSLLEQVMKYVDAQPGKEIVIQISYRTVPTGSSAVHDIHRYFLGATLADFRASTSLAADKVGIIPIAAYLPPGTSRSLPAFVFPRFKDSGEPNFTADTKQVTFRSVFVPIVGSNKMKYDIFVKMNPKQMIFKEELTF